MSTSHDTVSGHSKRPKKIHAATRHQHRKAAQSSPRSMLPPVRGWWCRLGRRLSRTEHHMNLPHCPSQNLQRYLICTPRNVSLNFHINQLETHINMTTPTALSRMMDVFDISTKPTPWISAYLSFSSDLPAPLNVHSPRPALFSRPPREENIPLLTWQGRYHWKRPSIASYRVNASIL